MEKGYKTSSGTSSGRWDFCRFLRTLAYFGVIPLFSRVAWVQEQLGSEVNPVVHNAGKGAGGIDSAMIFDFRDVNNQTVGSLQSTWGAVDDVVMGGVSSSRLQAGIGNVVFTGTVSTSNSGGFASVRTRNFEPPLDLASDTGIRIRVKGDGNRYKFLVRDAVQWDGVAYSYSFDTVANTWMNVDIPFAQMVPVFRARVVDDSPAVDQSSIRAFQFMLSKFEYDGTLNPLFKPGSFELYIESISTY